VAQLNLTGRYYRILR